MMERKPLLWILGCSLLVCSALGLVAAKTIQVDPFFHYHKPHADVYFYPLNNQRSQNNGIVRHFDYSGLITGTSMTENFKTSDAEALWGGTFVKTPFSGGSFKEMGDHVEAALRYNPRLEVVIRGLDMAKFIQDKDAMRSDLGEYPTYLYDDSVFNDVQYVFNRDVVFARTYSMAKANDDPGFEAGMTAFDRYANWMKRYTFGKNAVFPGGIPQTEPGSPVHLSEEEAELTRENVEQNVTSLAARHPNATFYCFFPPYSAKYWRNLVLDGTIYKQVEAERIVIEAILPVPNIKLFSLNCRFDITTDLNNYKDGLHYGEWINSLLLRYMHDGRYLLTAENYEAYLEEELQFYSTYDYSEMEGQEDYADDRLAAFPFAKETYDLEEHGVDLADGRIELRNAERVENQHGGKPGIMCTGTLHRDRAAKGTPLGDYLRDTEFIGFKMAVEDISPYRYLVFWGRKVEKHGQPSVFVYDGKGQAVAQCTGKYRELDGEWKQYVIDVSGLGGEATVIFNGGYVDATGSAESKYVFSDVALY